MNAKVCIDAGLALRWIIPTEQSSEAESLLRTWVEAGTDIIGPALLDAEVTSAIRKLTFLNRLSREQEEQAYSLYRELDVSIVRPAELSVIAWRLAQDYKLARTYEMQYLAVAELEDCELWSANVLFSSLKDRNTRIRMVAKPAQNVARSVKKAREDHERPDFPGLWREI